MRVLNTVLNDTVLVRVFLYVAMIPFMISFNQENIFELVGAF